MSKCLHQHDDGYVMCPDCRKKARERQARWAQGSTWQRDRATRLREEMLKAYGGKCACCGETEEAFLTLDHVDGVPDHHRRKSGKRVVGVNLYAMIKKEGYPPAYQLLCWNCNLAKSIRGVCPHQAKPHLKVAV
jgi:hypothetical protein